MVKIENDATYAVDNLNSSFSPNAAIMLATELTELIIRVQVWGMEPLETKDPQMLVEFSEAMMQIYEGIEKEHIKLINVSREQN